MYAGNDKTLPEKNLKSKWKDMCSEIGRLNIVKIHTSQCNLFQRNGKASLQIHMELERAPNIQNHLKKEQTGEPTPPDFELSTKLQ